MKTLTLLLILLIINSIFLYKSLKNRKQEYAIFTERLADLKASIIPVVYITVIVFNIAFEKFKEYDKLIRPHLVKILSKQRYVHISDPLFFILKWAAIGAICASWWIWLSINHLNTITSMEQLTKHWAYKFAMICDIAFVSLIIPGLIVVIVQTPFFDKLEFRKFKAKLQAIRDARDWIIKQYFNLPTSIKFLKDKIHFEINKYLTLYLKIVFWDTKRFGYVVFVLSLLVVADIFFWFTIWFYKTKKYFWIILSFTPRKEWAFCTAKKIYLHICLYKWTLALFIFLIINLILCFYHMEKDNKETEVKELHQLKEEIVNLYYKIIEHEWTYIILYLFQIVLISCILITIYYAWFPSVILNINDYSM